jgi:hypothetical protein
LNLGTKGWRGEHCPEKWRERGKRDAWGKQGCSPEEGGDKHLVAGGSPPGRGGRRRGRKLPETERGSGQREEIEPGLGLGQGKIF